MSVFHENMLIGASGQVAAGGISRSLRFNSSDSAYLSRTPASAGNRKTWSLSWWQKLVDFPNSVTGTTERHIFFTGSSTVQASSTYFRVVLVGDNTISIDNNTDFQLKTTRVFRDFSAWYHFLLVFDTTQSTASDRIKLYINGLQETTFSTSTYPTLNTDYGINQTAYAFRIGSEDGRRYFNGYLADIHFIDGQALTPSSFTEVSATTGQLIPKAYTGTFTGNSFWLKFSDNSSTTSGSNVGIGKDFSGLGNYWDSTNLQTTTGGPTSVAAASGALPIYNTTDTYGATKGTGTRTDSNSSSIVLALPMDGANNGTTFTDESATIKGSGSAKTVTANGNAKTVTSQSKYYGSSGAFDGGDDYLLASASADFQFGSGNFTIETWFYPNTGARMALYHGSYGTDWSVGIDFSNITQTIAIWASSTGTSWNLADGDSAGNRGSTVLVTGRWHHVAMVRNGATLQLYVNGILDKQFTGISGSIVDRSSSQPSIGTWFGGQYDLNGYLQDFRIYKGVAKYTGNFNPPSSTQNATVAAGNDSLVDTPTSYGTDAQNGGEVRGNYCTWNPLCRSSAYASISNGNLDLAVTTNDYGYSGTLFVPNSGKWYFEVTLSATSGNGPAIGIVSAKAEASDMFDGSYASGLEYGGPVYAYNPGQGTKMSQSASTSYVTAASPSANDVFMVAVDFDNGAIYFGKNGTWLNSGVPTSGASKTGAAFTSIDAESYAPVIHAWGTGITGVLNAGQRPFAYTAPSGFKALCDTSLPAPVVAKPSTVMDVKLYTGNASSNAITGLGFSPDLVWIKSRSSANWHNIFDVVRGNNRILYSNATNAEEVETTASLTSFDSTGFTLSGNGSSGVGNVNGNGTTYVAWAWDAGTTTSSNVAGSITTSLRASASSGFSVISYTGTGSAGASIGHGLGVAPAFALFKNRSTSSDWQVYHVSLGNAQSILLQSTAAAGSSSAFNSTSPTSTVITLGAGTSLNNNGSSHICYAWAPVAGYSSFGSYTGNGSGSPDGPFIYTGFRPRWILFKNASTTNGWRIMDTSINPYNVVSTGLYPYLSNAEDSATNWQVDYLSNGFKVRSNSGQAEINGSGNTIIYAAFAESPFNYSRAR